MNAKKDQNLGVCFYGTKALIHYKFLPSERVWYLNGTAVFEKYEMFDQRSGFFIIILCRLIQCIW
jgi:uncharacterized membrane protein YdjX (TVP38/TMEM64 family)